MLEPLAVQITRWTLRFHGLPPELTPARLRGALLIRYRRAVCPRSRWNDPCDGCSLLSGCSYGQTFAARPPSTAVLRRYRTLPRPYLFRPDPLRRDRFTLTLVGAASALLPRFIALFRRLGPRGLGPGEPSFEIERIELVVPEGTAPLDPHRPPPPVPLERWTRPRPPSGGPLTLTFLTPTTVRDRNRILRRPEPGPVLRRLRDRLATLGAVWCGGAPGWPYRELGALAEQARLLRCTTTWVPRSRRSGTTGHRYPVSGFTGTALWEDVAPELWPLLEAGELLGVGRHCAFGNGWYTLTCDRAEPDSRPCTARR